MFNWTLAHPSCPAGCAKREATYAVWIQADGRASILCLRSLVSLPDGAVVPCYFVSTSLLFLNCGSLFSVYIDVLSINPLAIPLLFLALPCSEGVGVTGRESQRPGRHSCMCADKLTVPRTML